MWFSRLSSLSRLRSNHFGCDLQQFGAECEPSLLRRSQIDGESDAIAFKNELDHAAASKEVRIVADCQDVQPAQHGEVAAQPRRFGGSNKNDATACSVLRSRNPPRNYALAVDRRVRHGGIEQRAEGIGSQNTDVKLGGGACISRPVDEFPKIVQVRRFDLIFRRTVRERNTTQHQKTREQDPTNISKCNRQAEVRATMTKVCPTSIFLDGGCCVHRLRFHTTLAYTARRTPMSA